MTFVNMIGRVYSFEEMESESKIKYTSLLMTVVRPYKNYHGHYDTDYFKMALFDNNHVKAQKYLKRGMGIAIKGRLEVHKWLGENEVTRSSVNIIVERLVFLPRDNEEYFLNND